MAYGSYGGRHAGNFSYGNVFPNGVKWLLIANISLFVLYFLTAQTAIGGMFLWFWLWPKYVLDGWLWQLASYMFLHDPNGFSHILFNMLMLWMFGKDIEGVWGTRRFLQFYMVCGIGAGICVVVLNTLFGNPDSRTIGASGAIYGLLLAYGMLFPEQTVMFSLLFPIKAKYFVMIMGGIAFLATFRSTGDGVSHVAHLGGMIWGYLFLRSKLMKGRPRASTDWYGNLRARYNHWRMERAKRKFQVYMRKHDKPRRGPGGWMH